MNSLTKLGLALLLVFSFFLVGLLYVLDHVLSRRRLRRSSAFSSDPENPDTGGDPENPDTSGDPEIPDTGGGGAFFKEHFLYLLCWKNPSRNVPASSATASPAFSAAAALAAPPAAMTNMASLETASLETAEECDLARWHAMYFGPSRALYTIEEESEEVESDGGMGVSGDELAETPFSTPCSSPFSTPCSSPVFFTPTSSPPRAATEAGRDPDVPSDGEEAGSLSTPCSSPFSAAAALAAPPAAMTKTASLETAEECDLARWHAMYFGPSRALYTIKEEREDCSLSPVAERV